MPLAPIVTIEDALQITLEDALFKMGVPVSKKTMLNWRRGKTKARMTVVERILDCLSVIVNRPLDQEAIEGLLDLERNRGIAITEYSLPWLAAVTGFEESTGRIHRWTGEVRRLLPVTMRLKPLVNADDAASVSKLLKEATLPPTAIYRETLRQLETCREKSTPLDVELLMPLMFQTLLYLLACMDCDEGDRLLSRLCERRKDNDVNPMSQVLDRIRDNLGVESDKELGQLLLEGQDEESARNEIRKWRRGERFPSWERVRQWSGRLVGLTPFNVYRAIAYARIIAWVRRETEKVDGVDQSLMFGELDLLTSFASREA